jgi:hypothetical protein
MAFAGSDLAGRSHDAKGDELRLLISAWPLHVIDDEHLDRAFRRFEFQSELLLHGSEN